MTYDVILALISFAFVASITPGPNNLMLMASGVNFGFRRTLPHLLGVGIGFVVMVVLVGLGLAAAFKAYPILYRVLTVFSIAYLLYLAWKIATAAAPEGAQAGGAPFTFLQAALFQWVNPKAWSMAMTAITVYAPPDAGYSGLLIVAIVFGAVNLPCVAFWTLAGAQLRGLLANPRTLQIFNITMAVLLVASLYPLLAMAKS